MARIESRTRGYQQAHDRVVGNAARSSDFDRITKLTSLRPGRRRLAAGTRASAGSKCCGIRQRTPVAGLVQYGPRMADCGTGLYLEAEQVLLAAEQRAASEPSNVRQRIEGVAGFIVPCACFSKSTQSKLCAVCRHKSANEAFSDRRTEPSCHGCQP